MTFKFAFPDNTKRTAVIGRTGTGKSVFGFWILSESDFDSMPWVIIDYKYEELINSVERIKEIGLNELPTHPGLYKVHPHPEAQEQVDAFLWRIWKQENTGVLIDEGYMLPDKGGFRALLTQGRSKHIPVITLSQRPVWISRFVFTQADYHAVFHLNDDKDTQTVQSFMPKGVLKDRLPDYHARWYDVSQDQVVTMLPVPAPDEIASRLYDRLKPRRKLW